SFVPGLAGNDLFTTHAHLLDDAYESEPVGFSNLPSDRFRKTNGLKNSVHGRREGWEKITGPV
ncbi:MAG: hypothetical protein KC917_01760, partial [Candidatus Omnitrophica bacterium]|nr:hypothetical protein [Candidatus Omnitrophota bacterium]